MTNSNHLNNDTQQILGEVVDAVEALDKERSEIGDEIRAKLAEAKAHGLEPAVIRALVRDRRKDAAKVAAFQAEYDLYEAAISAYELARGNVAPAGV